MFEVHGAADFLAAVLMGMAIVAGAAFVLIQTVEAAIEATNQTSKWLGRQHLDSLEEISPAVSLESVEASMPSIQIGSRC
jgi:hypothetical protein